MSPWAPVAEDLDGTVVRARVDLLRLRDALPPDGAALVASVAGPGTADDGTIDVLRRLAVEQGVGLVVLRLQPGDLPWSQDRRSSAVHHFVPTDPLDLLAACSIATLVVTDDPRVAHLAGALGRPVATGGDAPHLMTVPAAVPGPLDLDDALEALAASLERRPAPHLGPEAPPQVLVERIAALEVVTAGLRERMRAERLAFGSLAAGLLRPPPQDDRPRRWGAGHPCGGGGGPCRAGCGSRGHRGGSHRGRPARRRCGPRGGATRAARRARPECGAGRGGRPPPGRTRGALDTARPDTARPDTARLDTARPRHRPPRHRSPRGCPTPSTGPSARSAGWRRVSGRATDAAVAVTAETVTAEALLVVAGSLRCEPSQVVDAATIRLVADIAAMAPGVAVHLVVREPWRCGPAIRRLRLAGVSVRSGTADPDEWIEAHRFGYPVVIVAQTALSLASTRVLLDSQPQAAHIAYLADRRAVVGIDASGLRPTFDDEPGASEAVEAHVEQGLAATIERYEAVWCSTDEDAAWIAARAPRVGTVTIPCVPAEPPVEPLGLARRRGVVVLADRTYDASTAGDRAAVHFLADRVARLRSRVADLTIDMVVDQPSPQLRRAMHAAQVAQVPATDAGDAFRSARVAVDERAAHVAVATVRLARAAGTPYVLGSPATDLVSCAARLLTDDRAWHDANDLPATDDRGGALDLRAGRLRVALGRAGIDADGPLPPSVQVRAPSPVWHQHPTPARSSTVPVPADPVDRHERYRRWAGARTREVGEPTMGPGEVDRPPDEPPMLVVIVDAGSHRGDVAATIASIVGQHGGRGRLILCAVGPSGETVARAGATDLGGDAQVVGNAEVVVGAHGLDDVVLEHRSATGRSDLVGLLVAGDVLKPYALEVLAGWLASQPPSVDVVYADEDLRDDHGLLFEAPAKPDWSPDTLLSTPYTGRPVFVRAALLAALLREQRAAGTARDEDRPPGDDSSGVESEDCLYDVMLRASEHTDRIGHLSEPLLTRPAGVPADGRDAAADRSQRRRLLVAAALRRRGVSGSVVPGATAGSARVRYGLAGRPKVSVIIPTHDAPDLLRACVTSVLERSTYPNYELVVVDNNTGDAAALELLAALPGRVLRYPFPFNYARMTNYAASQVDADLVVFLNNDTEVRSADWLDAMVEHAQRPEVGVVGPRLLYPNGMAQHEGVLLGTGGWAHNVSHAGLWDRGSMVRDTSAVTGACMMVRRAVFDLVGGNDETLRIAYNDIDLCLRVRQAGYRIIYTPFAELVHHESATRGDFEHPDDRLAFGRRWLVQEYVDPYYSPRFAQRYPFFQLAV